MRCPSCRNNELEERVGPYTYKESGLDNVVLEKISIYTCPCGEEMVAIPNMTKLHTAIGKELIRKESPLSGQEIRFLRKNMGFSAVKLAETMGVDNASVSRWENGARKMSTTNDRMVRMLYCTMKGLGSRELVEEVFPDISKEEIAILHHFAQTNKHWEEVRR